jgi:enoyl-CoA hydratase/carnithine racemase
VSPLVRGAGEKAFCAGGDIRAITEVPGGTMQREFFMEEYHLDHLVRRGGVMCSRTSQD